MFGQYECNYCYMRQILCYLIITFFVEPLEYFTMLIPYFERYSETV